jgi:hypothetical protein
MLLGDGSRILHHEEYKGHKGANVMRLFVFFVNCMFLVV